MMRASPILSLLFLSTSGRWSFALNLIFAQARPVPAAAPRDLGGENKSPPPDTAQEAVLASAIIISLLLFVLISGFLLSYFLFGSKIRGYLLPKPRPSKSEIQSQPPLSSPVPSYGFGFDDLTEAEMDAFYAKERQQENGPESRIRQPDSPPYLTLRHQSESESPISPMQMEWDRQIIFQSPDIIDQSTLTSRRTPVKVFKEETSTTISLKTPNTKESSLPPISSHHLSRSDSNLQVDIPVPSLSVEQHSELTELPFYPSDRLE